MESIIEITGIRNATISKMRQVQTEDNITRAIVLKNLKLKLQIDESQTVEETQKTPNIKDKKNDCERKHEQNKSLLDRKLKKAFLVKRYLNRIAVYGADRTRTNRKIAAILGYNKVRSFEDLRHQNFSWTVPTRALSKGNLDGKFISDKRTIPTRALFKGNVVGKFNCDKKTYPDQINVKAIPNFKNCLRHQIAEIQSYLFQLLVIILFIILSSEVMNCIQNIIYIIFIIIIVISIYKNC